MVRHSSNASELWNYIKWKTIEGTQAWDTFMSLVATTRQLGISFFDYVRDRISQLGIIPSLSIITHEKSSLDPLGLSWQLE
jgi:hypothetical protein